MVAFPAMPPLVLVAAFLEGLSLTLIQGYLPLYLRRALGEPSFFTVAMVVAVPAIGAMVAANFWGGLSDVSGRLKPMILMGLLGYAVALGGIPLFQRGFSILVFVGSASLFYGTLAPSLKAYVTLASPGRREQALAYVLMAQSTGWLAGSFGGGLLLESEIGRGLRAALWICSTLLLAHALFCAVALRERRRDPLPVSGHTSWLGKLRADLGSLYENRMLLRLCALAFLFVAGNYIVWGFFAVYMVEHLQATVHTLRYALAASSVLGIASFFYIAPLIRRFGGQAVLAAGVTLYLGMYLGISLAHDPVLVGAIYALPLYSLVNVSANVLASDYSAAAQRSGGLGVLHGSYALAMIVGPATGGLLADRLGLKVIPWLALSCILFAAPLAWMQARRPRLVPVNGRIPR
jgi:predicted MFS family arabinose efflux permease